MLIFKEKHSFIDFAVKRNLSISQFPISQKPFIRVFNTPSACGGVAD
jgi:hypothetical protein